MAKRKSASSTRASRPARAARKSPARARSTSRTTAPARGGKARKAAPPARRPRPAAARPAAAAAPAERSMLEPEARSAANVIAERASRPAGADAERGEARGRYVYCIIRASTPLRFGAIGMDSQWPDVYTIAYRDMSAVVSDVPIAPLDSTRENVLAHERVNETVMRDHTVIPMSFGTIFKTREDILELLRSAYEAFTDVLNKMADKLEFGLKVLWDRDEMVRAIEQEDEDIHRLKTEISSQKGSTYFARMQYGRLIDGALQQRLERYVTELLQRLRDVSVASRVNRAIGDKMIMNAAFLVQRNQEAAFDRRIKEIASRFEKLTFKYTGPWPPYNFVNIRLKLERAGQH